MRSQFTALDDKITALPNVTGAQVDTTNTGPPGSSAGATVSLSGGVRHFNFDVLQGVDGQQGMAGEVTQSQLGNDLVHTQNRDGAGQNGIAPNPTLRCAGGRRAWRRRWC